MVPMLGEFSEAYVLEQARDDYAHGEAKVPLLPDRTALLSIDLLDEFVRPHWSPCWVPDATKQATLVRQVQDACRRIKIPTIHIGYETSLRGLNLPRLLRDVPIGALTAGFVGQVFDDVRFYAETAPQSGDLVILKHSYSAFHGTELETVLRNLGVDTVIICGTMTNFFCGSTAREAFWRGFRVAFGSDINSSDDPECQRAEIKTLRRGFARIMTASEIISELERSRVDGTHVA
jgi:nicotinamidase-related amidase